MLLSGLVLCLVYGVGARDLGERLAIRERQRARRARLLSRFVPSRKVAGDMRLGWLDFPVQTHCEGCMTRETYLAFCASLEGAKVDQPFQMDFETSMARHERNKKWFAILMRKDGSDFVNLKCEPLKCGVLRGIFKEVRPGWRMNKDHWISVDLKGVVPEEVLCRLIRDSHALTAPRMRKGRKPSDEPAEGVGIVSPDRQKP